MTEAFNMSLRQFLEQVGVTSSEAIEATVRETGAADGAAIGAGPVAGLDLGHTVAGGIRGTDVGPGS